MNGEKRSELGLREDLTAFKAITPADNCLGLETGVSWISSIAGGQVRALYLYDEILENVAENPAIFGMYSFYLQWQRRLFQTLVTDKIKAAARIAVQTGKNPDIFGDMDERIHEKYGRLLYDLCGHFIKDGKFDREKARKISATVEGRDFLNNFLKEFELLELNYNSIGLTKLKAMKDLLKNLFAVITESYPEDGDLLFMKTRCEGDSCALTEFHQESISRFENLYREDAFDGKVYSERATGGKIGYLFYEVVEKSKMHSVTLRHYPLPKNIKSNGKIIYMASPLINKPEIFDLAEGKSVIEGMFNRGYQVYLVDHGDAGPDEAGLGLDFYAKTVHDRYLELIKERNPDKEIYVMAYCMAGTLFLPYLARRAEERLAKGLDLDIKKIALMASPVKFDDDGSGQRKMREFIKRHYDSTLMEKLFGDVNVPPQVIEVGMREIQPGVQYTVSLGFYQRACYPEAIPDAAPFLYWLTHGTAFPVKAHREWIEKIFIGNSIYEGTFCLPSSNPVFDGRPPDMEILKKAAVMIFDYRGTRDPIAPEGSCVASETWGQVHEGSMHVSRGGLNRTIEKNVGHIFVVSKKLLAEYLDMVSTFYST